MRNLGLVIACSAASFAFGGEIVTPFSQCRPGAVKPAGWIRDRAVAAKNGYTACMDEVSEHFRIAWTTNAVRRGDSLQWYDMKNGSWNAEGGAYWFDGLVRLAWQLDDPELKTLARSRLDTLLNRVGENSCGFLWWLDRRTPMERDEAFGKGEWHFSWVVGNAERAVGAYYEATGDVRAKRALECAFGWSDMAERFGAGVAFVGGIADAWRLTKSPEVAKCLDVACARLAAESQFAEPPWEYLSDTLNFKRVHERKFRIPSRHGVNCQNSLSSVAAAWLRTGDVKLRTALDAWFAFFDKNCMLPYGMPVSDEEWGWAGARRGTETCCVAAGLGTRIAMMKATGCGVHGDAAERIYFNAGAATVSRDFRRHVYFQMPNRNGVGNEALRCASHNEETTTRYLRQHWPLCCTAALNRIIPEYVQGMWMTTSDDGVAATLYGPSTFTARIKCGEVAFTERTDYPFTEEIAVRVDCAPGEAFPLKFRIPGWCASPSATVNNRPVALDAQSGFAAIGRAWKKGDEVVLRLPASPSICHWADMDDGGRQRISISCGPLLFAYAISEKDDNTPLGEPIEPALAEDLAAKDVSVVRRPMPEKWDWPLDAPVKLRLADAGGAPLELVPYGCTKLRVSAFRQLPRMKNTDKP